MTSTQGSSRSVANSLGVFLDFLVLRVGDLDLRKLYLDFSVSSSQDPTEVTIYQTAGGVPQYFLLKKRDFIKVHFQ